MRNSEEGNTPRLSSRSNAFSESFLQLDLEANEPPRGDDPEGEGPWVILHTSSQEWPGWPEPHALWPLGERPERHDPPSYVCSQRSTALLTSIVRPIVGREPFYELGAERWRGGFPLLRHGRPEAWMGLFHPELAAGVSLLEAVVRNPSDVALLLEAIGPSARRRAGAILLERLYGVQG